MRILRFHERLLNEAIKGRSGLAKIDFSVEINSEFKDEFINMLATMAWCGQVGTHRTIEAHCDGDGVFRMNLKVDGKKFKLTDEPDEDDTLSFNFVE